MRKHENSITMGKKGRQTRTFEPLVVQNIGLELFELTIFKLDQKGRPIGINF